MKDIFRFIFILFIGYNILFSQKTNLTLSEAVEKSDFIIQGKVLSLSSKWINDYRGNHIYTIVEIKINDCLKGNIQDSIINLELIGGKIDDITEVAIPSLSLSKSEEVILFFKGNPLRLIDNFLFKFSIESDKIKVSNNNYRKDEFKDLIKKIVTNKESGITLETISEKIEKINFLPEVKNDTILIKNNINKIEISKSKIQSKFLLANMSFYQPPDWSDKLIIANRQGENKDSKLFSTNDIYISWGIVNNGDLPIGDFSCNLYYDGLLILNRRYTSFDAGEIYLNRDLFIGNLPSGTHTLKLVLDVRGEIQENSENDNEFIKTFTVYQPSSLTPVISKITPDYGSAGTKTEIRISGINLSDQNGPGYVEFFYRDGNPRIPAVVKTWTNNEIVCEIPIATINGHFASPSSGPVIVTTQEGTSNGYPFLVTFGTSGSKWGSGVNSIQYKVNENYDKITGEGNSIKAAAETWNSAKGNLTFDYSGTTSSTTTGYNGTNEIIFSDYNEVARTLIWYKNGDITESDLEFNKALNWGSDSSSDKMDIQSIALHEMGHWLILGDLYGSMDLNKTMNGLISFGEIKRSLSTFDVSGLHYLYGSKEIPSTPKLKSPVNLSTGVSQNLDLEWYNTVGATSFQIQVSGNPSFTEIIKDTSGIFYTVLSISSLSNDKTYYWRTRAQNSKGLSLWSDIFNFSTIPLKPSAPLLSSPIQNSKSVPINPVLTWNQQIGTIFRVQISTDSTFTIILKDTNNISGNSIAVNNLLNLTKYFWRVRASNLGGVSDWSSINNFTTIIAKPEVPILLSPLNNYNLESTSVSLNWKTSDRGTSYRIQISGDSLFSSLMLDSNQLSVLSVTINSLINNKTYYWRVNSTNEGGTSEWSNKNSFTVKLPIITLSGITNNRIIFDSTTVNESAHYLFKIKNIGYSNLIISKINIENNLSNSFTVSQFTFPLTIKPSEEISCSVIFIPQALGTTSSNLVISDNDPNNLSIKIPLSGMGRYIIPSKPILLNPINNSVKTSTNPVLTWKSTGTMNSYQVQLSIDSSFANIIKNLLDFKDTSITITDLSNSTTYYWRIRSSNTVGSSDWSTIWKFSTIASSLSRPILVSPLNDTTKQPVSIVFRWSSVKQASIYQLQVAIDSNFKSDLFYNDSTVTDTLKTISDLRYNKTYYWRINAKNNDFESGWSNRWKFSTMNRAPLKFALLSPTQNETLILTYPTKLITFKWNKSFDQDEEDIIKYLIFISGDYNFYKTEIIDTSVSIDIMSNLKTNNTYNWYIEATDGKDTTLSSVNSFKTSSTITEINNNLQKRIINFELKQNYPNPFNPETKIEYSIPENCLVTLQIYDIYGRGVETSLNKFQIAGIYTFTWRPNNLPSGVYYYKIQTEKFIEIKKMIYLR